MPQCTICGTYLDEDYTVLDNVVLCWDCAKRVLELVLRKFFKYLGQKLPNARLVIDLDLSISSESLKDLAQTVKNIGRPIAYRDPFYIGGLGTYVYVLTPEGKVAEIHVSFDRYVEKHIDKIIKELAKKNKTSSDKEQ